MAQCAGYRVHTQTSRRSRSSALEDRPLVPACRVCLSHCYTEDRWRSSLLSRSAVLRCQQDSTKWMQCTEYWARWCQLQQQNQRDQPCQTKATKKKHGHSGKHDGTPAQKYPAGQAAVQFDLLCPVELPYMPGGQGQHADRDTLPLAGLYVPGGQGVGVHEFGGQKCPCVHSVDDASAPPGQ